MNPFHSRTILGHYPYTTSFRARMVLDLILESHDNFMTFLFFKVNNNMSRVREALNNYINTTTQNIRAEFAIIQEANEDGTYVAQPLSGDSLIHNVRTYESALGFIKPIIGSIVTIQFYDNQTCYITNIIDYDTFTLLTQTDTTIGSQEQTTLFGKNIDIIGLENEITEENLQKTKNLIKSQNNEQSGTISIISSKITNVWSEKRLNMGTALEYAPDNDPIFLAGLNDGDVSIGGKFIQMKSLNELSLRSTNDKTILQLGNDGAIVIGDGIICQKTTTSLGFNLYDLLKELSAALTIIDTTIQSLAPNPALTALIQSIKTKTDVL